MNRKAELGGARLKAILWLLILLAGVYTPVKTIPVYIDNYELLDKMKTEARFATVNRRPDEEIRDHIYREIKDRDIPVRREDIRIENTSRGVRISVEYTVTVDLLVYQLQLHFNPTTENRAL
jgi:hypothetical protein